jgi:hypothetical protein
MIKSSHIGKKNSTYDQREKMYVLRTSYYQFGNLEGGGGKMVKTTMERVSGS